MAVPFGFNQAKAMAGQTKGKPAQHGHPMTADEADAKIKAGRMPVNGQGQGQVFEKKGADDIKRRGDEMGMGTGLHNLHEQGQATPKGSR